MRIELTKDLPALRALGEARIARTAAAERARYATPGKDGIYLAKREEAEAWVAAGEPEDLSAYPYLAEETGVTAPTTGQLALLWINLNILWVKVFGPQIEGREQRAKRAIAEAGTPAAIDAVSF
jgi:hypothetical protein